MALSFKIKITILIEQNIQWLCFFATNDRWVGRQTELITGEKRWNYLHFLLCWNKSPFQWHQPPQSLSSVVVLSNNCFCHNFVCFDLLDPRARKQKLFKLILLTCRKAKYSNSSLFSNSCYNVPIKNSY